MICPSCNAQNKDGQRFCTRCGAPLAAGVAPAVAPSPAASTLISPLAKMQATHAATSHPSLPHLLAVGAASALVGFGLAFCLGGGIERTATTAPLAVEEASEEPATIERLSGQDSEPQVEAAEETAPEEELQTTTFETSHAECSSFLQDSQWAQYYYGPECVTDGNLSTGWCEGASSVGVGEWVSIEADGEQWVRGVQIVNGHPRREDVYFRNCRCKDVTIQLSDGFEMQVRLDDLYNGWQTIDFGEYHQTSYIRLTIDSVYEGSEWDDTLIAEMAAY